MQLQNEENQHGARVGTTVSPSADTAKRSAVAAHGRSTTPTHARKGKWGEEEKSEVKGGEKSGGKSGEEGRSEN